MSTAFESRYEFHHPTKRERALECRICALMLDGVPRSKAEICEDLGLDPGTEIGARIRDVRNRRGAAALDSWPYKAYTFSDSRSGGPSADGIYRWTLILRAD